MKALWLRPLLTGGFLTATRGASCAAAADNSGTFRLFAAFSAAWGAVLCGTVGGGLCAAPYPAATWCRRTAGDGGPYDSNERS